MKDDTNGFYDFNDDYITSDKIKEDLINYYQELYDSNQTIINDFHEGSEIMNLIGCMAHLCYDMLFEQSQAIQNMYLSTAEGVYLDLLAENPILNESRIDGSKASGFVKFSIQSANPYELSIPVGTVVSNDNMEYETVSDGYIGIGELFTYLEVEAVNEGVEGNAPVNSINSCDIAGVSVTNEEEFNNGFDREDDEEFRERVLDIIRIDNFGSKDYYLSKISSFDNVHDCIIEDTGAVDRINEFPVYIKVYDMSLESETFMELINFFKSAENKIIGHNLKFKECLIIDLDITVSIDEDEEVTDDIIREYVELFFRGGEMESIPLSHRGTFINDVVTPEQLKNNMLNDLQFSQPNKFVVQFADVERQPDKYYVYTVNGVEVVRI